MCGIDVGGALSRREIIFIPCVNPDGVEIALHGAESAGKFKESVERAMSGSRDLWNANARGVDLNHNFNAGWDVSKSLEISAGITAPAPRRFGGYAPGSEPEVTALVRLCLRRMPRTAVALHSQGEEIYFEYGEHTPERAEHLAKIFAASSGYTLVKTRGSPRTRASRTGQRRRLEYRRSRLSWERVRIPCRRATSRAYIKALRRRWCSPA